MVGSGISNPAPLLFTVVYCSWELQVANRANRRRQSLCAVKTALPALPRGPSPAIALNTTATPCPHAPARERRFFVVGGGSRVREHAFQGARAFEELEVLVCRTRNGKY